MESVCRCLNLLTGLCAIGHRSRVELRSAARSELSGRLLWCDVLRGLLTGAATSCCTCGA
jgi:hypothetical protein